MPNIPRYYRPNTIRNVTLALVKLFENVRFITMDTKRSNDPKPYLNYVDSDDIRVEKIIPCPIHIGFYDKMWAMEANRKVFEESGEKTWSCWYRPMPSLSLTLDSIQYDGERAVSTNVQRPFYDADSNEPVYDPKIDSYFADIMPVPYNLSYSLELQCRSFDQICQFLESTCPYFAPDRSIRIKEFSFLNLERDIKVILQGTTPDLMKDQMLDEERRTLSMTLNFEVQAFLYRPFFPIGIIKKINSEYIIRDNDERKVRDMFEMFGTKFVAPVTDFNEETGEFVVRTDVNGDVIYEDVVEEDVPNLLQFYDERTIENYTALAYSGFGVSGGMDATIKPYQIYEGDGMIERKDYTA